MFLKIIFLIRRTDFYRGSDSPSVFAQKDDNPIECGSKPRADRYTLIILTMDTIREYKERYVPFPKDEYEARLEKVLKRMDEGSIDLLVSSSHENKYYLTNDKTAGDPFQIMLINRTKGIHIITRELEFTNTAYRSNAEFSHYTESEDPIHVAVKYIVKNYDVKTIGFEYDSKRISHREQIEFEKYLVELFDPTELSFKDASTLISEIRMIKSDNEVEYMRRSADMVKNGINEGIKDLKIGMTETQIAGIITKKMYDMGCEYTAYPAFVAAGWTGCMGHYAAGHKGLENGDILFLEIGASCNRYHAARMHTVYVGDSQPDWFVQAERLIRKAIEEAKKIMKPLTHAYQIDHVMRSTIRGWDVNPYAKSGGYDYPFTQSERSGYSIGIGFFTDWEENDVFRPILHPKQCYMKT
jgi:Xaa-Pro dipeptidase